MGTTLQGIDDTSFSAFQNLNAPFGTQLVTGNIFLGIQGYFAVRIPLGEQLGLARGGTIESNLVNAAVTLRAAAAYAAGGQIQINCILDDDDRDLDPKHSALAWKPPGGYPNAWRRDFWGQFDHRLEDTGGTPFLDTGTGGSGTFAILPLAGVRVRLAQPFTVPAGPGWSVARTILQLRRFGTPAGSMEVAIQANGTDGFGSSQPDGVDIAVSAAVANGTIPLTPGSGAITFAFTPDAVLPPGSYWTVLRQSVPYVPDFTNFIVWMQQRLFLGTGGSHFQGSPGGVALDQRNYPGAVDVHFGMLAKEQASPVLWNPPARSAGQTASTPDLSSLVQETILNSGHETASALCFTFRTVGQTITYRFASHDHPTLAAPGFAAQYRRRDARGGHLL